MNKIELLVGVFLAVLIFGDNNTAIGYMLGNDCNGDWECREQIIGSNCQKGRCACQPFYARINQTSCLPSTLLGYECQVPEQCSLKVANSSCLEGLCRCVDGFLQFRKHTCLGPARPGNVCYSNAHCQLWTADSHCDFLIPNLFGRCQCNSPFKQLGDSCVRSAFQNDASTTISSSSTTKSPTTIITTTAAAPLTSTELFTTIETKIVTNKILRQRPKNPFRKKSPGNTKTNSTPSRNRLVSKTTTTTMKPTTTTTELPLISTTRSSTTPKNADQTTTENIRNRITTMEPPTTSTLISVKSTSKTIFQTTSSSASLNSIKTRIETSNEGVSLGLSCVTDLQCRIADAYSKCVEGVCDCIVKGNETNLACSARNRGCIPGTFQCRSTGACISWFFVCDGRKDCSDGSDEECKSNKCPNESFRCRDSGKCISKANRCDGIRDCHLGEDEADCQVLENKSKCPPDTFQCADGKCLPEYEFCNAIVTCSDGSDEPSHICRGRARRRIKGYCPLRCGNGRCRSTAIACSGRDGCGDGTDENHCSVCRCPVVQGRSFS